MKAVKFVVLNECFNLSQTLLDLETAKKSAIAQAFDMHQPVYVYEVRLVGVAQVQSVFAELYEDKEPTG